MLEITGQFVVYQYCTICSLRYFMLDSPPACTEYNLPTRRGFSQTTDARITSWCTGCWSNVVACGAYRCTSARSISQKAFDRIKHSALWRSLQFYGVKPAYVRLLQRLYSQQEGTVLTDKQSDAFPIKRRTKQGDPLSSLLFNTVLQYSLEDDLKRWQEKRKGIRLSVKAEDCLTNLRFADDVLLFSTSLENYVKCSASSRPAQKRWVWASTRIKRKYQPGQNKDERNYSWTSS